MPLETSGGHYFDQDTGGVVGVARRNVAEARSVVMSGEFGSMAVSFAAGTLLAAAGRYAYHEANK